MAYDAESALEIVEQFDPDVAFLDLNLPGMSGFELAERIRAHLEEDSPTHVVALSGYDEEASRQKTLDAGFDAHLVKPMSTDALLQVIDEAKSPE
ncbi:MAG: response regulator [Bradymonadaceae bacterium]